MVTGFLLDDYTAPRVQMPSETYALVLVDPSGPAARCTSRQTARSRLLTHKFGVEFRVAPVERQ